MLTTRPVLVRMATGCATNSVHRILFTVLALRLFWTRAAPRVVYAHQWTRRFHRAHLGVARRLTISVLRKLSKRDKERQRETKNIDDRRLAKSTNTSNVVDFRCRIDRRQPQTHVERPSGQGARRRRSGPSRFHQRQAVRVSTPNLPHDRTKISSVSHKYAHYISCSLNDSFTLQTFRRLCTSR
jgi:hypothetical protein